MHKCKAANTERMLAASLGGTSLSLRTWRGSTPFASSGTCHATRGGAAMVMVLIAMAVATTIFLSVLKLIAVQRQSVELQTRQIQAGWLAESAVERACGTAFRRSKLPRRNLEHFRTRYRRARRRHDRHPRGRRPRQARPPHRPRRGRLPGRSLPTGPAGPRGDRRIQRDHRTNDGASHDTRYCKLQIANCKLQIAPVAERRDQWQSALPPLPILNLQFSIFNLQFSPRRGFTLVELLVVIAIIGILIGMMFPAVGAMQEAARRTTCQNRLAQLGMALQKYESGYGALPPGTTDPRDRSTMSRRAST